MTLKEGTMMNNPAIKDILSDIEDGLNAIEAIVATELTDELKDRATNFTTDAIRAKLKLIEQALG